MPTVHLDRRRVSAVLALRDLSFTDLARRARVTPQHLRLVLRGRRGASPDLLRAARKVLGKPGWAFAAGEVDSISD
jgi:transcriptional regulator with XRE-family HTH domain